MLGFVLLWVYCDAVDCLLIVLFSFRLFYMVLFGAFVVIVYWYAGVTCWLLACGLRVWVVVWLFVSVIMVEVVIVPMVCVCV